MKQLNIHVNNMKISTDRSSPHKNCVSVMVLLARVKVNASVI